MISTSSPTKYRSYRSKMTFKGEIDVLDIDWSDEAHFDLRGQVNKQNLRFWGEEKPEPLNEKAITRERVTVWRSVGSRRIIGPYFSRMMRTLQ